MRVITGTARGMRVEPLSGEDVRPTTDRVKEAMFSILQFELEGSRVLDLFAGSGQLGIEALSRGAAQAVFVDADRRAVELVKKNLRHTGLEKGARVVQSDYAVFLAGKLEPFDIALLDPPYGKGILQKALPEVSKLVDREGAILCECPLEEEVAPYGGEFILQREYRYGKIKLSLFRHRSREQERKGVGEPE